jgi:hypothetical protein
MHLQLTELADVLKLLFYNAYAVHRETVNAQRQYSLPCAETQPAVLLAEVVLSFCRSLLPCPRHLQLLQLFVKRRL